MKRLLSKDPAESSLVFATQSYCAGKAKTCQYRVIARCEIVVHLGASILQHRLFTVLGLLEQLAQPIEASFPHRSVLADPLFED